MCLVGTPPATRAIGTIGLPGGRTLVIVWLLSQILASYICAKYCTIEMASAHGWTNVWCNYIWFQCSFKADTIFNVLWKSKYKITHTCQNTSPWSLISGYICLNSTNRIEVYQTASKWQSNGKTATTEQWQHVPKRKKWWMIGNGHCTVHASRSHDAFNHQMSNFGGC